MKALMMFLGAVVLAFVGWTALLERDLQDIEARDTALVQEVRGLRLATTHQAGRLLEVLAEAEELRAENKALALQLAKTQKRLGWWDALKVPMADRARIH